MKVINIGKDFSPYPAGRYVADGAYSGERFRNDHLIPALISENSIIIEMDDTRGYDSSFLEEAFGGIFRVNSGLSYEGVMAKIVFSSEDGFLVDEVKSYMADSARRSKNGP